MALCLLSNVEDVSWANSLHAPDCVYRNGKYYLYFPNGGNSIGVATSDTPYGPFVDAVGHPIVTSSTPGVEDVEWVFDPSVLIDDDGQAYLYFGGGYHTDNNLRLVKLKPNIVELDGEARGISRPNFYEGAFIHKRKGKYYMSHPRKPGSDIVYLTSDNPLTGWVEQGVILPNPPNNEGRNSHHSIVEYKGQWYMFYHNRKIAHDNGASNSQFARSINVDYLNYASDGSIEPIVATWNGVAQLKSIDAFVKNEAEMFDNEYGIETKFSSEGGVIIGDISHGDWVKYSGVDFGAGTTGFKVRVASDSTEGTIELRIGSPSGTLIGTCPVKGTGGWQAWETASCNIEGVSGKRDLYMKFVGTSSSLFNINWWQFEKGK